MKSILSLILAVSLLITACTPQQIQNAVGVIAAGTNPNPTSEEAGNGLKEALVVGLVNGIGLLSKEDGFFGNNLVKIPWPEEAAFVMDAMKKIGMQNQVDKVTLSLNRAAEKASGEAKDVFIQAVKQMTFQDAMNILLGGDGAATAYLRKSTTPILTEKFRPIIEGSLSQVNATKYWSDAVGIYNKIPFTQKKVETDLSAFVTQKAMEGVFKMVEQEENKIRKDPFARSSALLKKVFGFADTKK